MFNQQISPVTNKLRAMYITNITWRPTGTYNDMFLRPYQMTMDNDYYNRQFGNIIDAVASTPIGNLDGSALATSMAGVFSISQAPESNKTVGIANGWGTRRYAFVLDVRCEYQTGGVQYYKIQGYTDHPGISLSSYSVDPSMVLYINNIMRLREDVRHFASGTITTPVLLSDQKLMFDTGVSGMPSENSLIRPADVFQIVDYTAMVNSGDASRVLNSGNAINSLPKFSRKANDVPTTFAANMLNAAMTCIPAGRMDNEAEIRRDAMSFLREDSAVSNEFLHRLADHQATGISSGSFRWRDLIALDPSILQRHDCMQIVDDNETFDNSFATAQHSAGSSEWWHGATIESRWAATLTHAVPSILMACGLGSVALTATNHGGRTEVSILNGDSFSAFAADANFMKFSNRLAKEILADLSYGDTMGYYLEVFCTFGGDTKVRVSVNGGPTTDFVSPTFCDSLFSPVVTADKNHTVGLAANLYDLTKEIAGAVMESNSVHTSLTSLSSGVITQSNPYASAPGGFPQRNNNPVSGIMGAKLGFDSI